MRVHPQRGRGYLYRRQRRIARDAPTKRRRSAPHRGNPALLYSSPRALSSARYSRARENAREMAPRDLRRRKKDTPL